MGNIGTDDRDIRSIILKERATETANFVSCYFQNKSWAPEGVSCAFPNSGAAAGRSESVLLQQGQHDVTLEGPTSPVGVFVGETAQGRFVETMTVVVLSLPAQRLFHTWRRAKPLFLHRRFIPIGGWEGQ
jgi:hypothetical protein